MKHLTIPGTRDTHVLSRLLGRELHRSGDITHNPPHFFRGQLFLIQP